ncbi:MAG: hypothetical protein UH071_06335, partial [Paludibacteraceae bacterium]|nr:hypothetical protein [Paludibacteraceae bacterium]
MRKIILLLVALLTCVLGYAQIDKYDPVWSGSGNYGFITVGNTNHRLAAIPENSFPKTKTEEDKELGGLTVIKNHPEVFKKISTIDNCNYADFMVSRPEEATCDGEAKIKKAFLSWGGRSKKTSKNKVHVLLRDRGGNIQDGESDINADSVAERDLYRNQKAMYLCHADVTDFVT